MIKSDWVGWNNQNKCPLCGREGEDVADVWKKGHKRENGIMLETGLSYCQDCAFTVECSEHWGRWWDEQWRKSEELAEENWRKHGVYTNVGGYFGLPSFHFGYTKTPDGLQPYLEVNPDCPHYKLERKIVKLKHRYGELGREECYQRIVEAVEGSDLKEKIMEEVDDFFNWMMEREKEKELKEERG